MSRRAAIREADVARAIKGAIRANLRLGEFELRADGDGIRIITFASSKPAPSGEEPNPWDSVHGDG